MSFDVIHIILICVRPKNRCVVPDWKVDDMTSLSILFLFVLLFYGIVASSGS